MTNLPADLITPGTTEHTQAFVRAHLPDGRIKDSQPVNLPQNPIAALSDAFGRMHLPQGTRFERLQRTITITATTWQVVDAKTEDTA